MISGIAGHGKLPLMAYLVVRQGGRVATTIALGDSFVVGRDTDCDLVVDDRLVSRRHMLLRRGPGGWIIRDQSSRHGTFVNGTRVSVDDEQPLRDGDQLQAGNVIMVFRDGAVPDEDAIFSVTAMPPPDSNRNRLADPEQRRLQLLFDVSRAIGALDDPDELIGRLLEGVVDLLGCDRGLVHLGDQPGRAGRRIARGGRAEEIVLSQRLVDAMLVRRETAVVRGGGGQPPALGAPLLPTSGKVAGFLYVTRAQPPFADTDVDYLTALAHLAAAALEQSGEQQRLRHVADALRESSPSIDMLGESDPMRKLRQRLERFARSDAAVLIRGESGTGKELVARTLHALSQRADQPFVAVNCAAIPETLIESELFGHEKGAFTGALRRKRGRFALADRGTLFLDEIGDLSASAQAKVLRAIEEGEIQPVGAELPLDVNVRIISATHKPLEEDIAAGRFRADLFYRLNVATAEVPPLRDRGDDILLLARAFLARNAARMGRSGVTLAPGAAETLLAHGWPGNVRELANEVERALLLSDGETVDFDDLADRLAADDAGSGTSSIAAAERRAVEKALEEQGGNIVNAARQLGISRGTLYRKISKYKLGGAKEGT